MADVAQEAYIKAIWQVLSQERLNRYGRPDEPALEIVARYLWNMAVCEALYPSLQGLEVAVRNTIFNAGTGIYPFTGSPQAGQVPCWLDAAGLLQPDERRSVDLAKMRLTAAGKALEPGRLIAELTFGFWTALFDVRYENTRVLWPRLFSQRIFAHAPSRYKNRKSLSPLLNRVRHLRNRAFHHEPIWHWRDLADHHAITLDLIGWMSPSLRQTVEAMDRFDRVHAAGLEPFRDIAGALGRRAA